MSQRKPPANIVLIGLMGAGKSTTAARLARALKRPLVDTDTEVEKTYGMSIAELFESEGEAGFRQLESETVARIASNRGQVIAVGGGTVVNPDNAESLRKTGTVFWLDVRTDILVKRMGSRVSRQHRPLLADATSAKELEERVERLRVEREEAYRRAAHHVITIKETESGSNVVAEIMRVLGFKGAKAEG